MKTKISSINKSTENEWSRFGLDIKGSISTNFSEDKKILINYLEKIKRIDAIQVIELDSESDSSVDHTSILKISSSKFLIWKKVNSSTVDSTHYLILGKDLSKLMDQFMDMDHYGFDSMIWDLEKIILGMSQFYGIPIELFDRQIMYLDGYKSKRTIPASISNIVDIPIERWDELVESKDIRVVIPGFDILGLIYNNLSKVSDEVSDISIKTIFDPVEEGSSVLKEIRIDKLEFNVIISIYEISSDQGAILLSESDSEYIPYFNLLVNLRDKNPELSEQIFREIIRISKKKTN